MVTYDVDSSPPSTDPNPVPPGYFSASFERLVRENEMGDWASAFTLFGEYLCLFICGSLRASYRYRKTLSRHSSMRVSTLSSGP